MTGEGLTTMFQPKPITRQGIERALQKVERYRLLNEPWAAESICLDVLQADPENQQAIIAMLLAITDQFGIEAGGELPRARELLPRITDAYQRAYYAGIICERRGKSLLRRHAPGTGPVVYDWLRQAMDWYEKAEGIRPPGNDDALLRWNTCARIIMRHEELRPAEETGVPTLLE